VCGKFLGEKGGGRVLKLLSVGQEIMGNMSHARVLVCHS